VEVRMGSYKPLMFTIAFMMFIGFFIPFLLGFFVDVSDLQTTQIIDDTIEFLETGFEIDILGLVDFDVNIFFWVPDNIMAYITESFTYLSLLPEFLVIICLVLVSVSFVYSIIALVRGN
jgi:hypothetical protein